MAAVSYYGTGKRKSSIARVWLKPGVGTFTVNHKTLDEYFGRETSKMVVRQPFELVEKVGIFDVYVTVSGGGDTGQSDAIAHGLARALLVADEKLKPALKQNGLLTRDSRAKERKKPGLKRARKAPQYTKR